MALGFGKYPQLFIKAADMPSRIWFIVKPRILRLQPPLQQFNTAQNVTALYAAIEDGGNSFTKHGEQQAQQRGFSDEKISDIQQNYSQKVYQSGGRTVYAQKNGNY
jgi:hypothetical protein